MTFIEGHFGMEFYDRECCGLSFVVTHFKRVMTFSGDYVI